MFFLNPSRDDEGADSGSDAFLRRRLRPGGLRLLPVHHGGSRRLPLPVGCGRRSEGRGEPEAPPGGAVPQASLATSVHGCILI